MTSPIITEANDPLAGFIFVQEGAQTLLGRLREDEPGKPYLDPVYVYRLGEESKLDPVTKQPVVDPVTQRRLVRPVRSLHSLLGYPEIHRKDISSSVGISVNDLLPESRTALAEMVKQYDDALRAMGIVTLVRPR
jgi:hypothetical protein